MALLDNIIELRGEESASQDTLDSIDLAVAELQTLYKEKEPYTTSRQIDGDDFVWQETFIEKVRYAFSTDSLDLMNNAELEVFDYLVQYQDEFSPSYDSVTYPNAIGCTNPDGNGDSFVIDNTGVTVNLCTIPVSTLEPEFQLLAASLDSVLTGLIDCIDYRPVDVGIEDLENVSITCPLLDTSN